MINASINAIMGPPSDYEEDEVDLEAQAAWEAANPGYATAMRTAETQPADSWEQTWNTACSHVACGALPHPAHRSASGRERGSSSSALGDEEEEVPELPEPERRVPRRKWRRPTRQTKTRYGAVDVSAATPEDVDDPQPAAAAAGEAGEAPASETTPSAVARTSLQQRASCASSGCTLCLCVLSSLLVLFSFFSEPVTLLPTSSQSSEEFESLFTRQAETSTSSYEALPPELSAADPAPATAEVDGPSSAAASPLLRPAGTAPDPIPTCTGPDCAPDRRWDTVDEPPSPSSPPSSPPSSHTRRLEADKATTWGS
jgi:hypothetical protein